MLKLQPAYGRVSDSPYTAINFKNIGSKGQVDVISTVTIFGLLEGTEFPAVLTALYYLRFGLVLADFGLNSTHTSTRLEPPAPVLLS